MSYKAGESFARTFERITARATQCEPPYPSPGEANDVPIIEIVKSAHNRDERWKVRAETLCGIFDVTDEDARVLELLSIVPNTVKTERVTEQHAGNRPTKQRARVRALKSYIRRHPAARAAECKAHLSSKGIEASERTIRNDLTSIRKGIAQGGHRHKVVAEIAPAKPASSSNVFAMKAGESAARVARRAVALDALTPPLPSATEQSPEWARAP